MALILLLLCGQASAFDFHDTQTTLANALPAENRELLHGIAQEEPGALPQNLLQIVRNGISEMRAEGLSGWTAIVKVSIVALLCGVANGLGGTVMAERGSSFISMVGILAVASIVLFDVNGMLQVCRETIQSVSVFSKTMLPVIAASVSVSGAPTRAAVMQAAAMVSLDMMIQTIYSVLLPAVRVYLAVMTVNYAFGQNLLGKTGEFILWAVRMILKVSMTLFVTYLSISGVFGGTTDAAAVKTAKAALSGMVPVVGGVISDATESLLAGAAVIRNLTGIFGVFCILAICLVPFLKMGMSYLLFKGGAAVLSIFCGKEITGYLAAIGESFGLMLGMLGACAAILFFQIVLSMILIGG